MSCVTCGNARSRFQCVCSTFYCSQRCQKHNWVEHKLVCGLDTPQSLEPSEHHGLNWVRGTNSSIFLSCYLESGKYRLMAKGEQFRHGFVPMRETIDSGITFFAGVNFSGISAYHPSLIRESGAYANRTVPFDPLEAWGKMRDYLNSKVCYEVGPLHLAYWLLRTKQYYGDSEDTIHLANIHKRSPCYTEHKKMFADARAYFASILRILDARLVLPTDFDATMKAFEDHEDWNRRHTYLINIENDIRRSLDLPFTYGLDGVLYRRDTMERYILEETPRIREFLRFVGSPGNTELYPRLIAAKLFAEDIFTPLKEQIRSRALVYEANVAVVESLYEAALSPDDPVFTLTPFDKAIVEDPIPLIIASTKSHGQPVDPTRPNVELALYSSVVIGEEDADIVFLKHADYPRFMQLLAQLDPQPQLIIRLNDEYFAP
jgi:hypothetical protein